MIRLLSQAQGVAVLFSLWFAALPACAPGQDTTAPQRARVDRPKIRTAGQYPFAEPQSVKPHEQLWQVFEDLPSWCQRGRLVYTSGKDRLRGPHSVRALKDKGADLLHIGAIRRLTADHMRQLKDGGLPLVLRLDGQFFWGDRQMDLMESIRPGGWANYHNTVPNSDWYRKFPLSLAATKVLRDGQLMREYYGSAWVQRRDINYIHPAVIQMRDAFLRECVLGEQVFDRPVGLACGGHASGVWWDNPGNLADSYDAYTQDFVAREFEKKFGARYR